MTIEDANPNEGVAVTSLDAQRAARHAWDLAERVAELEARVVEFTERERVREMELAAARRDLEVKAACNTMLESGAIERQRTIEWLQTQVAGEAEQSRELRARVEQRRRTPWRLRSTRAYHAEAAVVALQSEMDTGRRERADEAVATVAVLQAELAAERARISWRATNKLIRGSQRSVLLRPVVRSVTWMSGRHRRMSL